MIEAVTLDVYFYNELQGKRESVIFDQRINLATLTHFFSQNNRRLVKRQVSLFHSQPKSKIS